MCVNRNDLAFVEKDGLPWRHRPPAEAPSLRERLESVLETQGAETAEFSTGDPIGLVRDLEASGRFHKDTGFGRIFHPGRVSFREKKPADALHILIDDNRVSAHIDKRSPLKLKDSESRYAIPAIFAHNVTGMAEDVVRFVTGRRGSQRCELECERITLDGKVIDDFLQRPRAADFATDVGPGSGEAPPMNEGGVRRIPFSVIDEAVHLLDTEAAPWSIQLEIRVAGSLDEGRLRDALGQALGRHSMARARKVASRLTARQDVWELDPGLEIDPIKVVECPDDESLDSLRSELQSVAVPLAESPPLRARLARHPAGDVLMLNLNHAATDGFGALRILRSIARAYSGQPDPLARIDFLAARDLPERLAAANASAKVRRYAALAEKLRDLVLPPARLAAEGATDRAGYGFHLEQVSTEETRTLVESKRPGTVNDVLVAALHLAISEWNERKGESCGRIGVLVPANLRPPKWRHEMVGNFSLPARIATRRRHRRTEAAALEAVTAQTSRKKKSGMGTALIEIMKASSRLPLWLKQASVALLPLTGNRLVDTAMLSNLGRLDAPSFGDEAGETRELWFSAPARMPLGLSVGACTVNDRLHLVFRYRHRLFGPDAARSFAQCFMDNLQKIAEHRRKAPDRDPHRLPAPAAPGGAGSA